VILWATKWAELEFSTSLIKIIAKVFVKDKLPASREIAIRVLQVSVIDPVCTCICGTEKYKRHGWKIHGICFFRRLGITAYILELNIRGICYVNNVTKLHNISDSRTTWRHHIERTVGKALEDVHNDLLSIQTFMFKDKY
jgi:hypothetical protein